MKKYTIIASVVVIILVLAGLGFLYVKKNKTPEKPTQEVITELLSKKYNKATNEISIEVQNDTGKFAKGLYNETRTGGDRGVWFAAKNKQGWELVFDGNGIITCELANKYNFPTEVIPQCLEKGADGFDLIKR